MKRCLKKTIGKARMTYDELHTVLVEVEAILNSRPLLFVFRGYGRTPHTHSSVDRSPSVYTLPDPVTCSSDLEFEETDAVGESESSNTTSEPGCGALLEAMEVGILSETQR